MRSQNHFNSKKNVKGRTNKKLTINYGYNQLEI